MRWIWVVLCVVVPRWAGAVPAGWFERAVGSVTLGPTGQAGAVDVPLLKAAGDPRPRIEARIEEDTPVAALLDLGHGRVRLGGTLAARLGLRVSVSTWHGAPVRHTTLRWLRMGDLVLHDVRAEVVGGDELVVGVGVLPSLAVAVLPSEGVVRFVPAADATALLEGVSAPMATASTPRRWWDRGDRRWARGPGLGVPASLVVGGTEAEGWVRLRSDERSSVVSGGHAAVSRGGTPEVRARWVLPTADVEAAWMGVREGLDPTPEVLGTLGADVLAELDIAVAPTLQRVSMARATAPTWIDLAPVELAWVERRAATWEPPEIDPQPTSDPAGDPGERLGRARWSELAEARWAAGEVEASLRADVHLARVAGDHCGPWLAQGERLLRLGRAPLADAALQRAAELFEAWARMSPEERGRVRAGRRLPADTFRIPQPEACEAALSLWMEARLAEGDVDGVEGLYSRDLGLDPGPALALAVALVPREPLRAEALLREALARGAHLDATTRTHLVALQAARGQADLRPMLLLLSSTRDPHPLATAVRVVEVARWSAPLDDGASLLQSLVDADPHWLELRVAAEVAGVALEGPDLAGLMEIARIRRPGDAALACLSGLAGAATVPRFAAAAPPHPDCLVARALMADGLGAGPTREHLLDALARRWPLVPRPGQWAELTGALPER